MISSVSNLVLSPIAQRPNDAAGGARPHGTDLPGRPGSAESDEARPGEPPRSLLDTRSVTALQEHQSGDETRDGEQERGHAAILAKKGDDDRGEDPEVANDKPAEPGAQGLSEEERSEVEALKRADAEVRRHEAAHAGAGGAFAGQPSFTYQTGPDGKRYAVAGEVPIDVAPVAGDPEATIAKMKTVQRAANAPADPSGQDRAVAAAAARSEQQARAELAAERREEFSNALDGEAPESAETGPEAPTATADSRPAGQDSSRGPGRTPFGRETGPDTSRNASPFDAPVRSQADKGPGNSIQIATQRYATAASLIGAGDDNQLGAFQATGTATPRIERFA
jgi:hypothetical protein